MRRWWWLVVLWGCGSGDPSVDGADAALDGAVTVDRGGALDGGQLDGMPDVGGAVDATVDSDAIDAMPHAMADAIRDAMPDDMADAMQDDGGLPERCLRATARGEGVDRYAEEAAETTVEVAGSPCARRFRLVTRRGGGEESREVSDDPAGPVVRTGSPLFDALHALAVTEAREDAVEAIRDGAFREGAPVDCPPGGCFETGAEWHYVWTRDTAYAVDLGLAAIDATRAKNSLVFKTSTPRGGGPRVIVQDTGTGGSWPVSTDRVVWALGARSLIGWLDGDERAAFVELAREAMAGTVEVDDRVVYDAASGLYRGEQSFLDWREQSYPAWMAERPADIAASLTLGTNVGHMVLRRVLGGLGVEGMDAAADAVRAAIRARLLLPSGWLSAMVPTALNPAPSEQYELLGLSLAILEGVLGGEEGHAALSRYPFFAKGPPVIWPQQQFTPIYHNRAQWPFVTAYALRAAARVGHVGVMDRAWAALWRGAALERSNMENFEAVSGATWVEDGPYSGPVVNSERQLWSVAGYLGAVHEVVFGVRVEWDGVRFDPRVTEAMRGEVLGTTEVAVLEGLRWRGRVLDVALHLPAGEGDLWVLDEARVDGAVLDRGFLAADAVAPGARVRVDLTLRAVEAGATTVTVVDDPGAWRTVFAPRPPRIEAVAEAPGAVRLTLAVADDPADLTLDVLRDGVVVAEGLPGDTARWVDHEVDVQNPACYTVRARWRVSGWASHDAQPVCWWANGAWIREYPAAELEVADGERADEHGRSHIRDPGGGGVAIARHVGVGGRSLVQVVYGNGANGITTGITAAVRRVDVTEVGSDLSVGGGYVVLPQLGRWDRWGESTFVEVELEAGREYRVAVHADDPWARNMSWLAHFADYTGGPGGEAPYNRVNVAAIKVLALDPRR